MSPVSPRHQPTKFEKYCQIHDSYLERFRNEEFIGHDTLVFKEDGSEILLVGEIGCLGQILITVDKTLEVLRSGGGDLVQTIVYEYNVSVRGFGNVFRYDNSHSRIGHSDNHHKHEFDWRLNEQGEGKVVWIGAERWPTLAEVIDEAQDWYYVNMDELPKGYPELGLR